MCSAASWIATASPVLPRGFSAAAKLRQTTTTAIALRDTGRRLAAEKTVTCSDWRCPRQHRRCRVGNRTNYKRKHAVERSMPLWPAYGSGCVTRLDRDAPLFAFLRQHLRELSRSEEHTSELQSLRHLVCRLLLEKKKVNTKYRKRQHPAKQVQY